MDSNPFVVLIIIAVIAVAAVLILRKRGNKEATKVYDAVHQKLDQLHEKLDKTNADVQSRVTNGIKLGLERGATVPAETPGTPAQPAPAAPPVAPTPGPAPGATPFKMPDKFIDRDDLMKTLGAANFIYAVSLDNNIVHNGFGPALAYYTQADGSISQQQPVAALPVATANDPQLSNNYATVSLLLTEAERLQWRFAIFLDGQCIREGFGPADRYMTTVNGITRV